MKKTSSARELKGHLALINLSPSGFVPTMGALHNGHRSLVRMAIKECPVAIVSIFVNPTQFNDIEDLKNYPRTVEKDMEMLSGVMRENDIVFIPETAEIYPEEDTRLFNLGNLDKVMEGLHRPGHFNGVAQVVSRLFDIIKPDIAYFGQKDLQQLTVIKKLVGLTGDRVKIVGCPIIRESDGLAMSSRNQLLEPEIRKNAGVIYRTISKAAEIAKTVEIAVIKEYVTKNINRTPGFSIDYFEIADEMNLSLLKNKSEILKDRRYFGCIAVKAGKIRLIDNIEIPLL
ncbi:MAG: pantoate--beta-alanine ligase [Odoribacter sp.]|nr:pantoate--beta-alanine ligase [Odoribacter sp.]